MLLYIHQCTRTSTVQLHSHALIHHTCILHTRMYTILPPHAIYHATGRPRSCLYHHAHPRWNPKLKWHDKHVVRVSWWHQRGHYDQAQHQKMQQWSPQQRLRWKLQQARLRGANERQERVREWWRKTEKVSPHPFPLSPPPSHPLPLTPSLSPPSFTLSLTSPPLRPSRPPALSILSARRHHCRPRSI
jgi:hypothetical protein